MVIAFKPEVTRRKRKRRHEAADPQPAELSRAGAAARRRIPAAHRGRRGSGPAGSVQRRLRVPPGAAAALGRAAGGGGELGAPLGAAPRAPPQLRGRRGIPAPPPPRAARGGGAGGVPAVPGLGATLPHLQGGPQHAPDRGRGLKKGGQDPPDLLGRGLRNGVEPLPRCGIVGNPEFPRSAAWLPPLRSFVSVVAGSGGSTGRRRPDVTSVRSGSGLRRERRLERPEGTAPCPRRHRSTGTLWRSRWGRNPWGPWPGSGTCWAGNWRRKGSTRRTWCWGSSWCCARTRSCSGSGSRRRAGLTPNRAGTARAACASGATPSSEPPLPKKRAPPNPSLRPEILPAPRTPPRHLRNPLEFLASSSCRMFLGGVGGTPKSSRGVKNFSKRPQNHLCGPPNLPRDPPKTTSGDPQSPSRDPKTTFGGGVSLWDPQTGAATPQNTSRGRGGGGPTPPSSPQNHLGGGEGGSPPPPPPRAGWDFGVPPSRGGLCSFGVRPPSLSPSLPRRH